MTTPADTKSPAVATAPAGPVMSRSQVTWLGDRLFDAGPSGRTHRIDASATTAPGPVETLLSAIASCSSVDIIDIIAKRKTPVEKLSVNVTAERRAEFPRRVEKLMLEFKIDGAGIEHEHAERAIQLSYERYCSVAASLASDIVTETTLVLNGESFAPVRQKVWAPVSAHAD